jgi:anion-transporting  ArsA/GET3 family ATPase
LVACTSNGTVEYSHFCMARPYRRGRGGEHAPGPTYRGRVSAHPWAEARLHVVTGKGGTGKTTVAAALALALAAGGRRTLLIEVEGRQGIAQLFGTKPLPYEELPIAEAAGGGEVRALAVDAEAALLEYLEMFYKLGAAGRALRRFGAIDFATTIAPGIRDVLITGKVKEATTRARNGKRAYDAVVLDAPPTGRIGRFLSVTEETARLAKVGPIKNQSDGVQALLRSPMTAVHVVTLLEEMPVQETADAVAELAAAGLPVGGIVVNAVREPLLKVADLTAAAKGRLPRAEVAGGLAAAGVSVRDGALDGLLAEVAEHAERVALEKSQRRTLKGLARPTYELPLLSEGVDLGALYELAERLCVQGAA